MAISDAVELQSVVIILKIYGGPHSFWFNFILIIIKIKPIYLLMARCEVLLTAARERLSFSSELLVATVATELK